MSSGKATYNEVCLQDFEGTLGQDFAQHRTPLDELIEREEGPQEDEGAGCDGVRKWLLSAMLELVFADKKPMDWRYAACRGLWLLKSFAPGLLAGRTLDEAGQLRGVIPAGNFAHDALLSLVDGDPERLRGLLRGLLGWIYRNNGRLWIKEGTSMLYVLARGYHPQSLKKELPGKMIRGKWMEGREADMTYFDFAVAFGEKPNKSARARWCWRGKQMLSGTPHVPFQRGKATVEKSRAAAKGNKNRVKNFTRNDQGQPPTAGERAD